MSNTSFPNSAVVDIFDDIPGEGEFQGTGVIIGPHTILTAAHLVYDADTGAAADAISLYPGYTPGSTNYNPTGALGGVQSIHYIKVADGGEELSAAATQSDFAVIDTSADLTSYGRFALNSDFTSGDVVVSGYPASNDGNLTGAESTLSQDGTLSDIATSNLPLSPGYSGGPLYDTVERNGSVVDAVVGTVSTNDDAMKLTKAKVDLIRHWIASDASLYAGGDDAPTGLVPQISGTVSDSVDAASVTGSSGTSVLSATVSSGSARVGVEAPGQTVDLQPYDIVSDHHQADTTFVFSRGDGLDVIDGFKARGAGHDTIDLPSSDFTNFADVLRNTGDVNGNATITDPKTGDAIRLASVTTAELKPKDFSFG